MLFFLKSCYNMAIIPAKRGGMRMDPMTKMWLSLVAILIMGLSVFLITFARSRTTGLLRGILSVVAFIIMLIGLLGGAASIM